LFPLAIEQQRIIKPSPAPAAAAATSAPAAARTHQIIFKEQPLPKITHASRFMQIKY
jgi:hypothetical protein